MCKHQMDLQDLLPLNIWYNISSKLWNDSIYFPRKLRYIIQKERLISFYDTYPELKTNRKTKYDRLLLNLDALIFYNDLIKRNSKFLSIDDQKVKSKMELTVTMYAFSDLIENCIPKFVGHYHKSGNFNRQCILDSYDFYVSLRDFHLAQYYYITKDIFAFARNTNFDYKKLIENIDNIDSFLSIFNESDDTSENRIKFVIMKACKKGELHIVQKFHYFQYKEYILDLIRISLIFDNYEISSHLSKKTPKKYMRLLLEFQKENLAIDLICNSTPKKKYTKWYHMAMTFECYKVAEKLLEFTNFSIDKLNGLILLYQEDVLVQEMFQKRINFLNHV